MLKKFNAFDNIVDIRGSKIALKVKAAAKQNSINGFIEINNKNYLKISIKSPPEKGKANKMIIEFLAKELGIAKNDLTIVSGKTSQYKILHVKKL